MLSVSRAGLCPVGALAGVWLVYMAIPVYQAMRLVR